MSRYVVSMTLVLVVLWLLFSGMWTHPVILPLGAASVALTVYLSPRLGLLDRDSDPVHMIGPALKYWPWLLWQIVRANLEVARRIIAGPGSISPRIARIDTPHTSDIGRSIYANSITLTPGTVTIQVRDDHIEYYALTGELVEELEAGEMAQRSRQFGDAL